MLAYNLLLIDLLLETYAVDLEFVSHTLYLVPLYQNSKVYVRLNDKNSFIYYSHPKKAWEEAPG